MSVHFHPLKIAEVRRETDDAVSIAFEVPDELAEAYRFTQGQHVTLRAMIDGEDLRRSYSLCCSPADGELRVAVKQVEGGRFSSFANENLRAGSELEVMTPSGKFFTALDAGHRKTYAFFAAGSGITPIISNIKAVLDQEPQSRVVLFYGNRNSASILFHEQLDDLKNRHLGRLSVYHILSRETQDVALFNGRIDGEKTLALTRSLCRPDGIDEVFVCGPATMIEEVTGALKQAGVAPEHIHFELFTTNPGQTLQPKTALHGEVEASGDAARVTVLLDGKKSSFDLPFGGDSIVDGAARQGLNLPYSCKGGVCCTCRAKLVEGKVDMAVNYSLEPHEVAAGFVLTCQSRPLTDRVVLDFDEA